MAQIVETGKRRPEWFIPSGVFVVTLRLGLHVNAYAAGWVVRVSKAPVLVQVAVWEQNYDKVETNRSLPLYSRIGGRAPACCTGVGKALLAFFLPERLETVLGCICFKRFTASTITDREALLAGLSAVSERGYALDRGEHEAWICWVAAPIFDLYGEPVASLSVTDLARKIQGNEEWCVRQVLRVASSHLMPPGRGEEEWIGTLI